MSPLGGHRDHRQRRPRNQTEQLSIDDYFDMAGHAIFGAGMSWPIWGVFHLAKGRMIFVTGLKGGVYQEKCWRCNIPAFLKLFEVSCLWLWGPVQPARKPKATDGRFQVEGKTFLYDLIHSSCLYLFSG